MLNMLNVLHVDLGPLPTVLLLPVLILILSDDSDLLRAGGPRVKLVPEPIARELACELEPNHARAETQHLRVVGEDRALDAERVVRCHGADAGHLVGRNGDAEAWALAGVHSKCGSVSTPVYAGLVDR